MIAGLTMMKSRSINRTKVIRGGSTTLARRTMYVYLSSKPSEHYSENTAADFTVQLPRSISGAEECGVVEVRLPSTPQKPLFVCTTLCGDSIVNDHSLPVLRRVAIKTFIPSFITYIPLRVQSFDTIRIYICRETGEKANISGETTVTLHLR